MSLSRGWFSVSIAPRLKTFCSISEDGIFILSESCFMVIPSGSSIIFFISGRLSILSFSSSAPSFSGVSACLSDTAVAVCSMVFFICCFTRGLNLPSFSSLSSSLSSTFFILNFFSSSHPGLGLLISGAFSFVSASLTAGGSGFFSGFSLPVFSALSVAKEAFLAGFEVSFASFFAVSSLTVLLTGFSAVFFTLEAAAGFLNAATSISFWSPVIEELWLFISMPSSLHFATASDDEILSSFAIS